MGEAAMPFQYADAARGGQARRMCDHHSTMRRALGILCAGWAALLAVSLAVRIREVPGRFRTILFDADSRAAVESGDPVWHRVCDRLGPRLWNVPSVLLAADS